MQAEPLRDLVSRYAEPEDVERVLADTLARRDWRLRRGHKICTSCGEAKPVSEFGRDRGRRDGLEPRCRACRRV